MAVRADNRRISRTDLRSFQQYIQMNHSGEAPRPLRAASLRPLLITESEDSHV